jgi:hypothetical protein
MHPTRKKTNKKNKTARKSFFFLFLSLPFTISGRAFLLTMSRKRVVRAEISDAVGKRGPVISTVEVKTAEVMRTVCTLMAEIKRDSKPHELFVEKMVSGRWEEEGWFPCRDVFLEDIRNKARQKFQGNSRIRSSYYRFAEKVKEEPPTVTTPPKTETTVVPSTTKTETTVVTAAGPPKAEPPVVPTTTASVPPAK